MDAVQVHYGYETDMHHFAIGAPDGSPSSKSQLVGILSGRLKRRRAVRDELHGEANAVIMEIALY